MVACGKSAAKLINAIAAEINKDTGTPIDLARIDAATQIMLWLNKEMKGEHTELIPRYRKFCEEVE